MPRLLLMTALAAAAISMPASATGSPAASLVGVVGPGFNISLKNADGTAVTHLDAGMYTVNVDDRSDMHNFHLLGPGVDQQTVIENIETASWTVQFTDGTYNFHCDAHPGTMKGSFTVGNVPPPPPPPVKLIGKVTAKTISLTRSGSKVKTLIEGTYKLSVNDSSAAQNFHLSGPGVNRKTGVKAKTKVTWTVVFGPGKYVYKSDKSRRLRGAFTVQPKPPRM